MKRPFPRLTIQRLESRRLLAADFDLIGASPVAQSTLPNEADRPAEVRIEQVSAATNPLGLFAPSSTGDVLAAEGTGELLVPSPQEPVTSNQSAVNRGVDDDSFEILFELNRTTNLNGQIAQADTSNRSFLFSANNLQIAVDVNNDGESDSPSGALENDSLEVHDLALAKFLSYAA